MLVNDDQQLLFTVAAIGCGFVVRRVRSRAKARAYVRTPSTSTSTPDSRVLEVPELRLLILYCPLSNTVGQT